MKKSFIILFSILFSIGTNAKTPVAGMANAEAKVTPILNVPLASIEINFGIINASILKAKTDPKLPAKAYIEN